MPNLGTNIDAPNARVTDNLLHFEIAANEKRFGWKIEAKYRTFHPCKSQGRDEQNIRVHFPSSASDILLLWRRWAGLGEGWFNGETETS